MTRIARECPATAAVITKGEQMSITHMHNQTKQRANAAAYVVSLACERYGIAPYRAAGYAKVARRLVAKGYSAAMAISLIYRRIRG